jgi:S1-C subfamily serine protease
MLCFGAPVTHAEELQSQAATQPTSQPTSAPTQPLSPDKLYAFASRAVAKLIVKDEDGKVIGTGSAFLMETNPKPQEILGRLHYESTAATSYHVIRPAVALEIQFDGPGKYEVSFVFAEDPERDVCLLQVSSDQPPPGVLVLRTGPVPSIGERSYAISSPLGLTNSLSEGLISGYRERDTGDNWIQTTCAVAPGSSGGPLLNDRGEVLGTLTAMLTEGQNLNFAVPASEFQKLREQPHHQRAVAQGASVVPHKYLTI